MGEVIGIIKVPPSEPLATAQQFKTAPPEQMAELMGIATL